MLCKSHVALLTIAVLYKPRREQIVAYRIERMSSVLFIYLSCVMLIRGLTI